MALCPPVCAGLECKFGFMEWPISLFNYRLANSAFSSLVHTGRRFSVPLSTFQILNAFQLPLIMTVPKYFILAGSLT